MENKIVCFAGHRYEWQNLGIEKLLQQSIVNLIKNGYTIFYNGDKGFFDKMCAKIIANLKKEYPNVKMYKILESYKCKKLSNEDSYDGLISPPLEDVYYKQKITKRNEWIVENSDLLICHICEKYKSEAYSMVKYAQKLKKLLFTFKKQSKKLYLIVKFFIL